MFEASVTIYRKRLRTLVTTAAVLVLPYAVLYAFLAEPAPVLPSEPTVEELRDILTALGPWMLIRLFIATVMFAAVIRTVVEAYVGIESSWQRSTVAAINRLPALAVVTVLFWSGTLLGWMFLLFWSGTLLRWMFLLIPGIFLLVILGIFLLVSWSACLPVLIIEGVDPVSAMLRSWRMTSGRRWSLFGVLLVASLLVFLAGALVYIVAGAVLLMLQGDLGLLLASEIAWVLVQPFIGVVLGVLYLDLRVRKEDLDSDWLSLQLAATSFDQ